MAVTVFKTFDGETFQDGLEPSGSIPFKVFGTEIEAEARAAVRVVAPLLFNGLPIVSVTMGTISDDGWEALANYGPIDPEVFTFAFDTTGGTANTKQSRKTKSKLAPVGAILNIVPDFKGAINVTNDDVKGVEVVVPQYSWTETHRLAVGIVTDAFRRELRDLTGKTNNAGFREFAAGEVLFMGARGSIRTGEDFEILYSFTSSENWVNEVVGDFLVTKNGFDYFWVRFGDVEDTNAKRLVQRGIAGYVEEVYEPDNFAGLGIGTL